MPASTAQPDSEVASTAIPATHTAKTQTIATAALIDRRCISEEYARWLKGTVSECTHEPALCTSAQTVVRAKCQDRYTPRRVSFGENHMLFIVGVIVLVAAVAILRMRVPGSEKAAPLGWMSERWLAEHRASHSE
jgi:hypothetical protein